jgi:predicted RNase H-like nuclease
MNDYSIPFHPSPQGQNFYGIRTVTGVDACRRGWVAVSLFRPGEATRFRVEAVRVHQTLAGALDGSKARVVGIDMPLGLLELGWREADRAARGLLGPRRSSVFAIPPRAVWEQASYQAASQRCRELTGQGLSIQAWGLRARLLEADRYRGSCPHPLYEVHPELAFRAMAGAPLEHSKHTPQGRELRRDLLSRAGIALPPPPRASIPRASIPRAPVTDTLDAAAVAWSAWRIATGRAVVIPARPQRDELGLQIAIRY